MYFCPTEVPIHYTKLVIEIVSTYAGGFQTPVRHVQDSPQQRHTQRLGQQTLPVPLEHRLSHVMRGELWQTVLRDFHLGLIFALHCTLLQDCWVPNHFQYQFLLFFFLISSLRCCLSSFLLSLSCFAFDMPSTSTFLHHRRVSQKELGLIIQHLDLPSLPPALKKIGG